MLHGFVRKPHRLLERKAIRYTIKLTHVVPVPQGSNGHKVMLPGLQYYPLLMRIGVIEGKRPHPVPDKAKKLSQIQRSALVEAYHFLLRFSVYWIYQDPLKYAKLSSATIAVESSGKPRSGTFDATLTQYNGIGIY